MGWKLELALCQFLPSPEAPVVLVLVIIVDVVVNPDDIDNDREAAAALIGLARDNITGRKHSTTAPTERCKLPQEWIGLANASFRLR